MKKKNYKVWLPLLLCTVCLMANVETSEGIAIGKPKNEKAILVEKFKDRNTGCEITYEYYVSADGRKIMHGKYRRRWAIPKEETSSWSGREEITASFVENRLDGVVTINCEKYKWKRKSEFVKGKGRIITMVPSEVFFANNLKLKVKNDTLSEPFNIALGNYRYEAVGKVATSGELYGTYTLYKKNLPDGNGDRQSVDKDWVIEERYVCDPSYTYLDAKPSLCELVLGYPGTSKGEQVHIKIPRLRLSMSPVGE